MWIEGYLLTTVFSLLSNSSNTSSRSALQKPISSKYPELKADQRFADLQAQLEGTENRIAVERRRFNQAVQAYNTAIRKFPANIIAGIFGFQPKPYFKAQAGAETAPKVQF